MQSLERGCGEGNVPIKKAGLKPMTRDGALTAVTTPVSRDFPGKRHLSNDNSGPPEVTSASLDSYPSPLSIFLPFFRHLLLILVPHFFLFFPFIS